MLQERGIRYKWCHPFSLQFVWQNETRSTRTLEEAESVPDMDLGQSEPPPGGLEENFQAAPGNHIRVTLQLRRTPQKPSDKESRRERADLLCSLRHHDGLPEAGPDP
ncbi:hypothetical protein NDU88_005427 [Pleurodeles waltl]|uniref:Uncharacterized protein n=1 Tax=Pleurodeles waltl TaxID=8319 RepID=A0AAV7NRH4_PLEWA|nr:hypothetical protein NDU88_005427 [Pleurodeles waltl]